MANDEVVAPKVFISYSHDTAEHEMQVLALANRLRSNGIDCDLDQYNQHHNSPPQGWTLWMIDRIDWANFVLVICTETYYRRVMGREKPGRGLGARWEGHLTLEQLYQDGAVNTKFIPILLPLAPPDPSHSDLGTGVIPDPLRAVSMSSVVRVGQTLNIPDSGTLLASGGKAIQIGLPAHLPEPYLSYGLRYMLNRSWPELRM